MKKKKRTNQCSTARLAVHKKANRHRVEGLEEAIAIIGGFAGDWPDKAAEDAGFLIDQIQRRIDVIRSLNYTEPYYRDRIKNFRGPSLDFIIIDDPWKEKK